MRLPKYRAAFCAALCLACSLAAFEVAPACAGNGGQVLDTILGTGARIMIDQMQRDRTKRQKRQQQRQKKAPAEQAPVDDDAPSPVDSAGQMPEEEKLTRKEMAELQRALNSLGFDVGKADGKGGTRTGRAVSRFLQDRGFDPYQTPVQEAYRMILSAAGRDELPVSAARRPATAKQSAMQSPDTIIDGRREDEDRLGRELVRRMVKADPALLDNEELMFEWLAVFADRGVWPDPKLLSLYERTKQGSEFDKDGILAEFRSFLKEQATDEPLTIVRVRRGGLERYDFDKEAFPLSRLGGDSNFSPEMNVGWLGYPDLTAVASTWNDIDHLPIPAAEAEALAKRFKGNRWVDVALRMTLSNFKPGKADATIEDVSVHFLPSRKEDVLGELLANLPVGPIEADALETAAAAGSALESWRRLGAPVQGDAILIDRESEKAMTALVRPVELLMLKKIYKATSAQTAYHYARKYATEAQFRTLFARGSNDTFLYELSSDDFRRRETIEKFNAKFLEPLSSRAPKMPVPARLQWTGRLGRYDFDAQSFDLGGGSSERLEADGYKFGMFDNFVIETNLSAMPGKLPMEKERARRLNDAARGNAADPGFFIPVFFTLDVELTGASALPKGDVEERISGSGSSLEGSIFANVTRFVLYEDEARTKVLAEYPLDEYTTEKAKPASEPATPLFQGHRLSRWNLVALTAKHGAGGEVVERAIRTSASYSETSDDKRPAQFERMKKLVESAIPEAGQDIYLLGTVAFGEHDASGRLPIVSYGLQVALEEGVPQVDDNLFTVTLANAHLLSSVAVDQSLATRMRGVSNSLNFPVLFRMRPVASKRLTGDRPIAALEAIVDKMVVLYPDTKGRILAEIAIETTGVTAEVGSRLPQSRFEVLGMKLGMPIEEARKIAASYATTNPSTPRDGDGDGTSPTVCEVVAYRMKERSLSKEQEEAEYRKESCPVPESSPFVFAFGYELQLSDKLTERLFVYRTGTNLGEPVVSAIYRQFNGDEAETLLQDGLPRQYGDDFVVPNNDSRNRVWVSEPSRRALIKENPKERCVPFWVGGQGYPELNLLYNCGAFLRADSYRLVLIDTAFASRVANAEAKAAKKAEKKPEIRF